MLEEIHVRKVFGFQVSGFSTEVLAGESFVFPDLKANQNMMQLSEELTSTENRVSFARQSYNDAVMVYNTAREVFPNVMIAGPLGFTPAQLFEVEAPAERQAPKVQFT